MSDIDWDLVFRYYGGECSAEEREHFERWLAADPMHVELVDALRLASDRVLRDLHPNRTKPAIALRPLADRQSRPQRFTALAASIALLAATGVALWMVARPVADRAMQPVALRMTTTPPGRHTTIHLPDGTSVTLGVASTLRYPADLGDRSVAARQVELEGEAYFDVVHDPARPFRVRAGGALAEDIGTTFDVRAYGGESVRVLVATGSVAVRPAAATAATARVLTRGDLARIPMLGVVTVKQVDPERYLAWTRGELVFEQTSLDEVAAQLSRWYDVDVQLADSSLAGRDFTGGFRNEAVDEVLDVLSAAARLHAERHGRVITLFGRARR